VAKKQKTKGNQRAARNAARRARLSEWPVQSLDLNTSLTDATRQLAKQLHIKWASSRVSHGLCEGVAASMKKQLVSGWAE